MMPALQQGGDGSGCLHDLRQPAMQREGRRLESGGEHQKHDGCMHREARATLRLRRDRRDVARAECDPEQDRGERQRDIAAGPDQREFRGCPLCFRTSGIEQQQLAQAEADRHECQNQRDETARLNEQKHAGQGDGHPAVKGAFALLAIQIGARVTHDDPADEGHEDRHGHTQRIKAERDHQRITAKREALRARENKLDATRDRRHQGRDRDTFGQERQAAGSATRVKMQRNPQSEE